LNPAILLLPPTLLARRAAPSTHVFDLGVEISSDMGPVLGWVNVLQWHLEQKRRILVVFWFEGRAEKEKDGWFKDVNRVCIDDDYWLNDAPFKLTLDLHSGVFGHTVHDPMTDLATLMGMLLDAQGAKIKLSDNKVKVRMRLPSLSLHGIDGAFSGPGAKDSHPRKSRWEV
ncbi:hypothetical protein C8J57DRAFT_221873, partial [Mycena rebaudengoi]